LVVAAQLLTTGHAAAQAVSLTTTSWLPGPDGAGPSTFSGTVDQPLGATSAQLTGWVVDTSADGWAGIDKVQVWNGLMDGDGQLIGDAVLQVNRPDVAATLGNPFYASSGFTVNVPASTFANNDTHLASHVRALSVYIYAHGPSKGWWYQQVWAYGSAGPSDTTAPGAANGSAAPPASGSAAATNGAPAAGPRLDIETPTDQATVHSTAAFTIRGTAYDPLADPSKGTGVDRVQVYLNGDRKSGVYIGNASLGIYNKFTQQVGQENAGFELKFQPNSWLQIGTDNQVTQLTIYAHSALTGGESSVQKSIVITVP
jgi:hypothetical protein